MSKFEDLAQELEGVQNAMHYHTRHGGSKEDESYKDFEQKEADILAQMDEAKNQELVEAITAESIDPESSFGLSARGFTADFRALTKGEDEYQMASVTTRLYLADIEMNHESEIKAIENSFNSDLKAANERNALLEEEVDQLRKDLMDVRGKLETANNTITDLEIERDGAIKESEARGKQIEELRQQITEKPKVATNLEGGASLAEISARLEAKKIPVYNVRPGDHKTSFYLAQLADTGEEIEIRPYYELKSKYREVTADEAARFRSEYEAAQAAIEIVATDITDNTPLVEGIDPPPAQFQNEDNTVPEYTSDRTVDEETTRSTFGTIEERIAALELEVFGHVKAAA